MESALRPPADPDFRLIETALWTPEGGLHNGALHLSRLARTADRLGIAMRGVDDAMTTLTADGPRRLRLTVDAAGRCDVALHPFASLPDDALWKLAIANERLAADNPWLRVKTTQRHLYDIARAQLPKRVDELLFLNERDEVCEGTITNVFADLGQGLVTPPVTSGLLPGVLRQGLLEQGRAREQVLHLEDLREAKALYVGNSLRGLIRATLRP